MRGYILFTQIPRHMLLVTVTVSVRVWMLCLWEQADTNQMFLLLSINVSQWLKTPALNSLCIWPASRAVLHNVSTGSCFMLLRSLLVETHISLLGMCRSAHFTCLPIQIIESQQAQALLRWSSNQSPISTTSTFLTCLHLLIISEQVKVQLRYLVNFSSHTNRKAASASKKHGLN